MRFGLCTSAENAEKAIDIGYDYAVLSGTEVSGMSDPAFDSFAHKVRSENIKIEAFNAFCPKEIDICGPGYSYEKAEYYIRKLVERGKLLGVSNIGIGAPFSRMVPEGYDRALAWKHGREFISMTAGICSENGIDCSVEQLCSSYCNFINTLEDSLKIAEEAGIRGRNIIVDFFHLEADNVPPEAAEQYMPYVRDIHISGIDRTIPRPGRPFITKANLPQLLKAAEVLRRCGYNGSVSLEPAPGQLSKDELLKQASIALGIMQSVFFDDSILKAS